jgi:integrase
MAALRHHRARQDKERHTAGDLWQDLGLIFPNTLGRPMEPRDLLADVYRPLLKRAGLPPITFHALRHTAATLLLAEGEHPKVVQELLGHAQISITLDRYSHMTPRLMSNAAALMDGCWMGRSLVHQLLTAPSHRGRPAPVRICGGHPHSAVEPTCERSQRIHADE